MLAKTISDDVGRIVRKTLQPGATKRAARRYGQAAGRIADQAAVSTKVSQDVSVLVDKARTAFKDRQFSQAKSSYTSALAAFRTRADAEHVFQSLSDDLARYGQKRQMPWNRKSKIAPMFEEVLANSQRVSKHGDVKSVIQKSWTSLAAKDKAGFDELHGYAKDLVTKITFPYNHSHLSNKASVDMARRVEKGSWELAEHYLSVGRRDLAEPFLKNAMAPTISRPSFERSMREVSLLRKHGAFADFSERQASELVLGARNKFRFSGKPVEETQDAFLGVLKTSLAVESKALPPEGVVKNLLTHARTPEEVGSLLTKARSLGYRGDLKADIKGAIVPPALAGVTMNGTGAKVQAIDPAALVAFAEQQGFGAEAMATLATALNSSSHGGSSAAKGPLGELLLRAGLVR